MKRLTDFFQDPYSSYFGDKGAWLVAYVKNRDSELIEEINFEVFIREFKAAGLTEGKDYDIERASHWACGWIDFLVVPPGSQAEKIAENLLAALEDYPCLDDDLYSERAWEIAAEFANEISDYEKEEIIKSFGLPEKIKNDDPAFIQAVQQYLNL